MLFFVHLLKYKLDPKKYDNISHACFCVANYAPTHYYVFKTTLQVISDADPPINWQVGHQKLVIIQHYQLLKTFAQSIKYALKIRLNLNQRFAISTKQS